MYCPVTKSLLNLLGICQTKHTLHDHLEEQLHVLVCIHARLRMQQSDTLDPGYQEVCILQNSTISHCNVDDLIVS